MFLYDPYLYNNHACFLCYEMNSYFDFMFLLVFVFTLDVSLKYPSVFNLIQNVFGSKKTKYSHNA